MIVSPSVLFFQIKTPPISVERAAKRKPGASKTSAPGEELVGGWSLHCKVVCVEVAVVNPNDLEIVV
jgi:hypothetical protein